MLVQDEKHPSEDNELLIKEYSILVELIKHQHIRVQDFDKTFLTANTILIAACAILLRGNNPKLLSYLIPLCLLGMAISLIWACVLQRMSVDSDLRWFQLRATERALSRPNGIFTAGYRFFQEKTLGLSDGEEPPLKFPTGIKGILPRFRVVWAGAILPFLFVILYVVLMFVGKLSWL